MGSQQNHFAVVTYYAFYHFQQSADHKCKNQEILNSRKKKSRRVECFWIFFVPFSASSSTKLLQRLEALQDLPGSARLSGLWHRRGRRAPEGQHLPWRLEPWPPSDVGKRTSRTESREILPNTMSPRALEPRSCQLRSGPRVPSGRPEGAEPGTAGSDWPRALGAWPRS